MGSFKASSWFSVLPLSSLKVVMRFLYLSNNLLLNVVDIALGMLLSKHLVLSLSFWLLLSGCSVRIDSGQVLANGLAVFLMIVPRSTLENYCHIWKSKKVATKLPPFAVLSTLLLVDQNC